MRFLFGYWFTKNIYRILYYYTAGIKGIIIGLSGKRKHSRSGYVMSAAHFCSLS